MKPFSVGLNCALGAGQMRPFLQRLAAVAECWVSVYPNAGLPNAMGGYDDTPDDMAKGAPSLPPPAPPTQGATALTPPPRSFPPDVDITIFTEERLVNIVGGCCGSTEKHVAAIAAAVRRAARSLAERALSGQVARDGRPLTTFPSPQVESAAPRPFPMPKEPMMRLSGLEDLTVDRSLQRFVNVGERCNIAGSMRFKKLIKAGDYASAMQVARKQVEDGAMILDVNVDDGMIDGVDAMSKFLKIAVTEPDIAKVPFMVDSSKFEIVEAGLQLVQGKCIVNSISLKAGEEEFLRNARIIKRYGAAVVVMAFDEVGQAATADRKVEVCERSYRLLVDKVGFPPEDIVFDPNILTIATGAARRPLPSLPPPAPRTTHHPPPFPRRCRSSGMEEHNNYAVEFIEAAREIKKRCPYTKISGGVSNLSFGFRGVNTIREAIHSVFLYYAIEAGMDMGIVNAGMLQIYDEIPKVGTGLSPPQSPIPPPPFAHGFSLAQDLLKLVEDAVLNRHSGATEALMDRAVQERERIAGAAAVPPTPYPAPPQPPHPHTVTPVPEAKASGTTVKPAASAWRDQPVEGRLTHALVKGIPDFAAEVRPCRSYAPTSWPHSRAPGHVVPGRGGGAPEAPDPSRRDRGPPHGGHERGR